MAAAFRVFVRKRVEPRALNTVSCLRASARSSSWAWLEGRGSRRRCRKVHSRLPTRAATAWTGGTCWEPGGAASAPEPTYPQA